MTIKRSRHSLLTRLFNLFDKVRFRRYDEAFSTTALIRAATNRAGISDFGDLGFTKGLEILVDSMNQNDGFHPFGRFFTRQMIIAMLIHRLRLSRLLTTHPEICGERIVRPLFILGLPRSGTTLLFNLLAGDPAHRFMHNWEAFTGQVPPRGTYTFASDPRRRQAKWVLRFVKYLARDLDTLHEFLPDGPEECTPIVMQGFASQSFVGNYHVPQYASWLDGADHLPTYLHHQRVLQALQWKYPGDRWLLKSPEHIAAIDAIIRVYPDARIVHIHRNPVKSVASWASLNLCYRGIWYPEVDTGVLGRDVLERLASDMDRCLVARRAHDTGQFFDLQYGDLVRDPLDALRRIYGHFGFEMTAQMEPYVRAHTAANPQHKHGHHKYDPEDFGLTEAMILRRFEAYISEFAVPCTVTA